MTPVCRITAECIQRTAVELWKYFVTVLVGLLHCDAAHTLSGLLRQVAIAMSVSGLSRFLKSLAWSTETLTVVRQERFNAQVVGEVAEAHVRTKVKKLGACQVMIVKPTPKSQYRYWVTSRLHDTLDQVVAAVATRWTNESLCADFKELMGSDQYQIRSARAIVHFWALSLCL